MRLLIGKSAILLLGVLFAANSGMVEKCSTTSHRIDRVDKDPFGFFALVRNGEAEFKSVRFVLFPMADSPFGTTGVAGSKGLDVTVQSKEFLQGLGLTVYSAQFSPALPHNDKHEVLGTTVHVIGRIDFDLSNGESFYCSVTTGGFVLESEKYVAWRSFCNLFLAKVLNERLVAERAMQLQASLMECLSGESCIESGQRLYRDYETAVNDARDGETPSDQ